MGVPHDGRGRTLDLKENLDSQLLAAHLWACCVPWFHLISVQKRVWK